MRKSTSIEFISACILAVGVVVVPMTAPASAQVTTPGTGTPGNTTGTTTTNYERHEDRSGLWGLTGLLGLLGLLGRRKEDTYTTTTRRDDATLHRDPNIG